MENYASEGERNVQRWEGREGREGRDQEEEKMVGP